MNLNEKRVREYAYQIWESEGKPHGQHHRHWEMACKLAANQTMDEQNASPSLVQADAPSKKARGKKQAEAGTEPKMSGKLPEKKAAETKSNKAKTTRQKKAKVVTDTLETQLTPINDGFEGSV